MSQPLSFKASLLGSAPKIYTPMKYSYTQVPPSIERPVTSQKKVVFSPGINIESDLNELQNRYEKETNEIHKSYLSNYERQLKAGKTIQELEIILEEEKRKYVLLENRFQDLLREYDSERRLRIDLEHDVGGCKEEIRRKDLIISDLDTKLGKVSQDNAYLNTENNNLRGEISRISEVYHIKLGDTEERYLIQIRELNGQMEGLRSTLEQQGIEYNNQFRENNRQWEARVYQSEDRLRDREREIAELEAELRGLADHNNRLKLDYEEEIRRQVNLAREDEKTRWQLVIKDLEAQIRIQDDERDVLARKNQDLVRDISIKERQIQDLKVTHDIELSRQESEISDLRNHLSSLGTTNDKVRNDLLNRESVIGKLQNELNALGRELEREREVHQHEINRAVNEHHNDTRRWEDRERELRGRIADLERALRQVEDSEGRIRFEYERLREHLTGNINKMISQTFVEHDYSKTGRLSFL